MTLLRQVKVLMAAATVLISTSCSEIKQDSPEGSQRVKHAETTSESTKGCSIKFEPTNAPEIVHFKEAAAGVPDEDKCQALWGPVVREDLENVLKRKDYQTAGYLSQEMLAICPEDAGTLPGATAAHIRDKLGDIYRDTVQYDCAIESYEKVRGIVLEWNPYDPFSAAENVINKLSALYTFRGDLWEAERWDRELLKRDKLLNNTPDTEFLVRMAWRSIDLGLFVDAEQRFLEAESVLIGTGLGESFNVARILSGLGQTYDEKGDYIRAQQFHQQAQKILEKRQRTMSGQLQATESFVLGLTYVALGRVDEGIELLESARVRFKNVGEPSVGVVSGHLANAYRIKGDYLKADGLYKEGEAAMSVAFSTSRRFSRMYFRHAIVALLLGKKREALDYLRHWQELVQRDLQKDLKWGAQNEKVQYLASRKVELDGIVSLQQQFARVDGEAIELSLNAVLNMKGRALDSMAYGVQNWRFIRDDMCAGVLKSEYKDSVIGWLLCPFRNGRSPDELFNRLALARHRLTVLDHSESEEASLRPVGADEKLRLKLELDELEERLGSLVLPEQLAPVTVSEIQQAIPDGAALVEFVQYRHYNPEWRRAEEAWGDAHYLAYVLHHEGEPKAVDLGASDSIDGLVHDFRERIENHSPIALQASRNLYVKVLEPLRQAMGDASTVLIAPDGQLNLVPFGALKDGNNRYLLEDYVVSYLTSGRELLKLKNKENAHHNPIIFANPKYGLVENIVAISAGSTQHCSDSSDKTIYKSTDEFLPLPCTEDEARAIGDLYSDAELKLDKDASRTALFAEGTRDFAFSHPWFL